MIFAIDPGTAQSAWILLDNGRPRRFGIDLNATVLETLILHRGMYDVCIEMIACMGMAVGESTLETVVWIGRFIQAYDTPARTYRMKRHPVKQHLCFTQRAKDPNIRPALIDRFGGDTAIGKRAEPGPLFGISADVWAALAVGVTFHDRPDLAQRLAQPISAPAITG